MISAELAGGDCLNIGCVPSKSLLRCARMVREARRAAEVNNEFGVRLMAGNMEATRVEVDFPRVMERMRKLRAEIAPVDGHARGHALGTQTFQGRGVFVSEDEVEVVEAGKSLGDTANPRLKFRNAVLATGGSALVPEDVKGLRDAPYTTNANLFNLRTLPPRMVILGAGVVALEMAQAFSSFGSQVTVLARSSVLSQADPAAGSTIQTALEEEGVKFLTGATVEEVITLRMSESIGEELPLMKLTVSCDNRSEKDAGGAATCIIDLECECLLVATGRSANVRNMGLEAANVDYHPKRGVLVDNYSRSTTNSKVYAVGDCVSGMPRLTHVSGEMAKVVVQNALFGGEWTLSSLVIPSTMYTEPEYAVVGDVMGAPDKVDVYTAELAHNDRAILDGDRTGFIKVVCQKGTGIIIGCTVVASRAGEIINEASLAIKHGIGLEGIGRNIHSYPTTGESLMGCGLQFINSKWERMV